MKSGAVYIASWVLGNRDTNNNMPGTSSFHFIQGGAIHQYILLKDTLKSTLRPRENNLVARGGGMGKILEPHNIREHEMALKLFKLENVLLKTD